MSDELRVPHPQNERFTLERGGRFGLTIRKDRTPQTWIDQVWWLVLGFVAIVTAWYVIESYLLAVALLVFGGFVMGTAFERWTWLRAGEEVPE